ncbi:MAG: hypothetical protein ACREXM_13840 [Gammaproteobacteria bacterium]
MRPVTIQPQSLGMAPAALSSPAVAVITSGVRRGPANQRVESVATLLADEAVVIRSEIDGRIGALDVQEGQPIVLAVTFVFLRSVRATLIPFVTIPGRAVRRHRESRGCRA